MVIQEMTCEDCKNWAIENLCTGKCKVLNCSEPYNRPAANCSSFDCKHKANYCAACINKNVCK